MVIWVTVAFLSAQNNLASFDLRHQQDILAHRAAAHCILSLFHFLRNSDQSGTNNDDTFQVTHITIIPHFDAQFELKQVILTI